MMEAKSFVRPLYRNAPARFLAGKLGIDSWYRRHLTLRDLAQPTVVPGAHYDPARGLLTLRGSWRTIGAELARVTPVSREAQLASAYRNSLGPQARRSTDLVIDEAIDYLRSRHANVAALIEGAASAGNGTDLRDMALANIWPSIVAWRDYAPSCAAVAVRDGGVALGQNLDVGATNNVVVAHIVPDDGPARLCHLMPGWLWLGVGINQFGLTYGGGSVNVARAFTPSPQSLPTVFCNAAILDRADSVAAAEEAFRAFAPYGPPHDGMSVVVADMSGALSRVELTGPDVAVHRCESGASAANHFSSAEFSGLNRIDEDGSRAIVDNSRSRIERAERSILRKFRVGAHDIRRFLREARGDGAWCRTATAPDTGWTTASYVIDLRNARYHYWLGTRPQRRAWREIDLEPLFKGHGSL